VGASAGVQSGVPLGACRLDSRSGTRGPLRAHFVNSGTGPGRSKRCVIARDESVTTEDKKALTQPPADAAGVAPRGSSATFDMSGVAGRLSPSSCPTDTTTLVTCGLADVITNDDSVTHDDARY